MVMKLEIKNINLVEELEYQAHLFHKWNINRRYGLNKGDK